MFSQLHKSQFFLNSEILPHASFFSCWNLSELLQDLICAAKCFDSEFCIDAGLPLCNLTCIDVASWSSLPYSVVGISPWTPRLWGKEQGAGKENGHNENNKQKIKLKIIISNLSCLYKSLISKTKWKRDNKSRTSPMLQKKMINLSFLQLIKKRKKKFNFQRTKQISCNYHLTCTTSC